VFFVWSFELHCAWCSVATLPAKLYRVQPDEILDHLQPGRLDRQPSSIITIQLRAISAQLRPASREPEQLNRVQSAESQKTLIISSQPSLIISSQLGSIASSKPRAKTT
jgi:hypothetical protein